MKRVIKVFGLIVVINMILGYLCIKSYADLYVPPNGFGSESISNISKKNETNDLISKSNETYYNDTAVNNNAENNESISSNNIIYNEVITENNSSIEKIDNRMENVTTNVSGLRTIILTVTIVAVIALCTLTFLLVLKKKIK